jgi:hypothetical protein
VRSRGRRSRPLSSADYQNDAQDDGERPGKHLGLPIRGHAFLEGRGSFVAEILRVHVGLSEQEVTTEGEGDPSDDEK